MTEIRHITYYIGTVNVILVRVWFFFLLSLNSFSLFCILIVSIFDFQATPSSSSLDIFPYTYMLIVGGICPLLVAYVTLA